MKGNTKVTISVAMILVVVNLIPLKTGPTVGGYCGMEYFKKTLTVSGVPSGYLQNTTHTGCSFSLLKQGHNVFKVKNQDGTGYDNYHFKASAFLEDLLVGVAILASAHMLAKRLSSSKLVEKNRRRF